jgi:DEAD/DEAH box helicase domain-containing protein
VLTRGLRTQGATLAERPRPGDDYEPQIFIYDNYPGGIGFSEPLFAMDDELRRRTRELIAVCECQHGCPTCVGPIGNTGPLAKTVALRILDLIAAGAAVRELPA